MLYLNTRHTLPRVGIDMQASTLSSRIVKPTAEGSYHAPQSNLGTGPVTVEIDSYPSRHSYGARTMGDFTREEAQEAFSAIRSGTSKHTQAAWAMIDGGAKKGSDPIAQQAHRELSAEIGKQRRIEAQAIPNPEIRVHPAELMGDIDPGRWDYQIQTAEKADVTFNPGHIRIYLEDPGSIHSWVTEGHYDIYA